MISRYMGPHYGNDVALPGRRQLPAEPADQPAGVGPPRRVPERLAASPTGSLHLPLEAGDMSGATERPTRRPLTRRRFMLGATRLAAGGAAVGVGVDRALEPAAPRRAAGRARRAARRACPTASTPGARRSRRDAVRQPDRAALRPAAVLRRATATRRPRTRACSRPRCARSSARYRVGPVGAAVHRRLGPALLRARAAASRRPIPRAKALSDFELPAIDDYDLCLHLACDDEQRLRDVEAALVHGAPLAGADGSLDLSSALRWRETRTGFVGAGLPAAHQDVGGIPPGNPVPQSAPLFMGFKSGLQQEPGHRGRRHDPRAARSPAARRCRSATCACGSTAGIRTSSERERVARMYAPAGHARAGRALHHRRRERPAAARARRSTATA